MRAVYEIYSCNNGDSDERVTIDVSDDPTYSENCVAAVKAAGYDPYEQCDCGGGPATQARFVCYAGRIVEVPVEVMAQVVQLVNKNRHYPIEQSALRTLRLREALIECGCAVDSGCALQLVDSE